MESQGIRDIDRWKDKIEVRLDNRQVAFLFFGSALVACMLFILGVVVGKRLESRGRAMAPEIEDPLALLDRVAATTPSEPAAAGAAPGAPRAEAPPSAPQPKALAAKAPKAAPLEPAARPTVAAQATALPSEEAPPTPTQGRAPSAEARGPDDPIPPSTTGAKPAAAAVDEERSTPAPGEKARFVLQIGAFADRAEAEAFAASFAEESPSIITAEISGKGVWYRVRFGAYPAFKDAVAAKTAFEKRHNKIALVVGPL